MKHTRCAAAVGMSLALLLAPTFSQARALTQDEFLDVLEVLQNRTRDIEFQFEAKEYKVEKRGAAPTETPYYAKGRILTAGPPGVKMLWEMKFVSEWQTSEGTMDKPGVIEQSYAFDGQTATHIRWHENTEGAEERRPQNQAILEGRPTEEITLGDHKYDGLALIPSYYMDKGLAQTLRESRGWQLLSQEGSQCVVRYAFRTATAEELNVDIIRDVTLDLSRGGAITEVKEYYGATIENMATIKNPRVGASYDEIELKEVADGVWLPVSARYNAGSWILRYSFSEVKVNQSPDDNVFRLKFVPGYQVWDKISNIKFVAGPPRKGTPVAEIGAAVSQADELPDKPSRDKAASAADKPATPAVAGQARSTGPGSALMPWVLAALAVIAVLAALLATRKKKANSGK